MWKKKESNVLKSKIFMEDMIAMSQVTIHHKNCTTCTFCSLLFETMNFKSAENLWQAV